MHNGMKVKYILVVNIIICIEEVEMDELARVSIRKIIILISLFKIAKKYLFNDVEYCTR